MLSSSNSSPAQAEAALNVDPTAIDSNVLKTDVLVVGGGPVGLCAAYELRKRGVDCLVVDRDTSIPMWSKANGLNPRTMLMFRQQGLLEEAMELGVHGSKPGMIVNGVMTCVDVSCVRYIILNICVYICRCI